MMTVPGGSEQTPAAPYVPPTLEQMAGWAAAGFVKEAHVVVNFPAPAPSAQPPQAVADSKADQDVVFMYQRYDMRVSNTSKMLASQGIRGSDDDDDDDTDEEDGSDGDQRDQGDQGTDDVASEEQGSEDAPRKPASRLNPSRPGRSVEVPEGWTAEVRYTPLGQKYTVVTVPDGQRFQSFRSAHKYWDEQGAGKQQQQQEQQQGQETSQDDQQPVAKRQKTQHRQAQTSSSGDGDSAPSSSRSRDVRQQQHKLSTQRSTQTSLQPMPPGWHVAKHTRTQGSKAGYVDYYYAGPVGKRLRSAGEVNQRFKQHADAVQAGPAGQQVHEYLHRCAAAPGQACEEVPGRQEVEGVAAPEALLLLYSRSMAGGWRSKKELLDDVELGQGKGQQEQQRQQQQATSDSQQQLEDAG